MAWGEYGVKPAIITHWLQFVISLDAEQKSHPTQTGIRKGRASLHILRFTAAKWFNTPLFLKMIRLAYDISMRDPN